MSAYSIYIYIYIYMLLDRHRDRDNDFDKVSVHFVALQSLICSAVSNRE